MDAIEDKIDTVLLDGQLEILRQAYSEADMTQILSSGIPGLDKRTASFIGTIRQAFYDTSQRTMEPKDRERCLIAILASRDAGLNLALHMYVGLMVGLSQQEIADIIFLGGIYTGVDRISDGLAAEVRMLEVLSQLAVDPTACTVPRVLQAMMAAFGRPPLPPRP